MGLAATSTTDAPSSRGRRVWANCALAGVSIAVTLMAIEGAVRIAVRHADESVSTRYTEPDPVRGWRHRPGARGRFGHAEYLINSRGLRDVEHELGPASVPRVLLLGDSFAEGFSVDLDESVGRRLERELRGAGCPAEVVIGGTVGYSTDQAYLFYRDEGAQYAPRVVVLLFYYDDVLYNARGAVPGGVAKPLFTFAGGTPRIKNYPLTFARPAPAPRPWRGSAALTWARQRLREGAPRTYDLLARLRFWSRVRPEEAPIEMRVYEREPPEPVVQAWLQTEHLLSLLKREAAAHGARLVIAYAPSKMEVSRADWDLTCQRYGIDARAWDRGQVVHRLEAAGARLGIPVLGLTDALWREQGGAYFPHGGHWNARGHAVAAREIARFLAQKGRLECPAAKPSDGS